MNARRLRQQLVVIVLLLLGLGLIAVASASALAGYSTYGDSWHFVSMHAAAVILGAGLSLACLSVPAPTLRASAKWILLGSLLVLALVLVFGQETGGARRWFRLGRLSFQPAEVTQVVLIVYLADLLARKGDHIRRFTEGMLPALIATGLAAGLTLLQPDLGTAVSMGAVTLLLLVIAKARWSHLIGVAGLAVLAVAVLVLGTEYRRQRMLAYLDPWSDPQGRGYQIVQSYLALASGGLLGQGLGGSIQKLFYLPSAHTDFLFAILGDELGLIGTTAVILLFALLTICGFRLAMLTHDPFGKFLICGLVGMLALKAIINIAVVTGMVPTKGLPLPFLSYGGTAMIMHLVACGLILHASRAGERYVPSRLAGL